MLRSCLGGGLYVRDLSQEGGSMGFYNCSSVKGGVGQDEMRRRPASHQKIVAAGRKHGVLQLQQCERRRPVSQVPAEAGKWDYEIPQLQEQRRRRRPERRQVFVAAGWTHELPQLQQRKKRNATS
eukprot:Skav201689  [mRNA]  locus=scaffold641:649872:654876:- [translate_table: standard]